MEAAKSDKPALVAALDDLRKFQVLDPACGTGNLLFVACREMKRLEHDLLVRLQRAKAKIELTSAVSIQQFHGLETQPITVELAKVTLMLAKELEIRESARLGETEDMLIQVKPLPLDYLGANIRCAEDLCRDDYLVKQWTDGRDALVYESHERETNHALKAA
ncbi:MAG TPA: DNA methyltransferase [Chthoniobacteraceae bacterium]|jgi:hypothetical protein